MTEQFPLLDVTVRRVADSASARAFVGLPYELHRDDPNWVPPLRRDESRRWKPHHNRLLLGRQVDRFLAYRGSRAVGRIAAIVDREFERKWEPRTGLFGFFECADDVEAAQRLFRAAEVALARRDVDRSIGPINLTSHDETGILVQGFDSPPMVMSPYNPPSYQRLIEAAGYRRYLEYHSYRATPDSEPSPAVKRIAAAVRRGAGAAGNVSIRALDGQKWDRDLDIVFDLYNASFRDVWGFVPITRTEFAARAKQFQPFVVPDLIPIAEIDGRPVGFALMLPDVNRAIARANGRLLPLGWLRVMRAIPGIDTARFVLLGVEPGSMGRGIGPLLALAVQDAARRHGIREFELSLVQATNDHVQRVIDAFGCPIAKTYRLYERTFARGVATSSETAA